MSWNPNQGQDPNQPEQPGGYQQGGDPQPGGYQQQSGYQPGGYQQQPGYQPGGYQQQPGYQPPYSMPSSAIPNPNGPTSMGMDANVAAGLSYLFSIVGGLIFYFGEKQNRFVRFHAMQSILFNVFWIVLFVVLFTVQSFLYASVILIPLGFVFTCLTILLPLALLAVWIVLMVYAFQGKYFKLPIIGDYAEKYAAPTM
jgi:uncharacterized membrane protein